MSIRQIELEVMRYDPEQDEKPHFQKYTVPCPEEWVILDALNREGFDAEIVEHADGDYEVKPTDSQAREMGKIPQGQRWTP